MAGLVIAQPAGAQPEPVDSRSVGLEVQPEAVQPESPDEAIERTADDGRSQLTRVHSWAGPGKLPVLLQPTPGAPTVTVCTSFDAGSRRDPVDAPGAQRLLAEMLVEGGYYSPHQNYAELVERRGGHSELVFSTDAASFCTTVPALELPLALWVAAGRFTGSALTAQIHQDASARLMAQAEALDADIRTGVAPERLRRMAFLGSGAWAHAPLPTGTRYESLDLELVRRLHEEGYVASRASLAVAGGFSPEQAQALITEHLEGVPVGTEAAPVKSERVKQTTSRFSMAQDDGAKTPAGWYGWVAPTKEQDRRAVAAALLLLTGETRLGRQLVGAGKAAERLEAHLEDVEGPALFRLEFIGQNSRALGAVEKAFDAELRRLTQQGPSQDELNAALTAMHDAERERLVTAQGRALQLSRQVLFGRAPEQVLAPLREELPEISLSPEQVKLAAATYLDAHQRSAVEIYPKGWQDPWQRPMPTFHIVSKGETLGAIATQFGTTVAVITKMNGISRNDPIYPGDKLRVPRPRGRPAQLREHTVRRGDTLSGLAVKYGVSAREIAEANGMSTQQHIRLGETLQIPWPDKKGSSQSSGSSSSSTSVKSSGKTHTVTKGQTLGGIAKQYGVTLSALASANGLTTKSMVRIGQELVIPTDAASLRPGVTPTTTYTVKSGDTLSEIAKRHGVTTTELEQVNHISRKNTLKVGQKLQIPKK